MMTPILCPLCGADSRELFLHDGIGIRQCGRCAHQFADVEPDEHFVESVYGDDYFCSGRAGYPDYLREAEILRRSGRRYARLVGRYCSPGRVLDIGAAAGLILSGFVQSGWTGVGVEPNARMAEYGRRELGLEMVTGPFEETPLAGQFDLVNCIQVLAHFPSPTQVMRRIRDLVRPHGLVLIETWDRESWIARAFGRHWHEYSPPSVLQFFGRTQINQLMRDHEFEPVATGHPAKWISGAHAKSLIEYKLANSLLARPGRSLLRCIPDRLPIPYPAFDLAWFLFRRK